MVVSIRRYRVVEPVLFFMAVMLLAPGLVQAAGQSQWGHRIIVLASYA
jgi:hypothetical protein